MSGICIYTHATTFTASAYTSRPLKYFRVLAEHLHKVFSEVLIHCCHIPLCYSFSQCSYRLCCSINPIKLWD